MESIKVISLLIIFCILIPENTKLVRGLKKTSTLSEDLEIESQLQLINKPATSSFVTEYGEIFDCVKIDKQLAFDHPLLKNHTIQMKPSKNVPRPRRKRSPLGPKASVLLPKKIRCPKGTVLIKRVQREDLLMAKLIRSSSLMKSVYPKQNLVSSGGGHEVAHLQMVKNNVGIHGNMNVWGLNITRNDQFSCALIYIASSDGSMINGISAGWAVNPFLNPNHTMLFTFWTRDSGQHTGCYNMLCPGFVQVSPRVPVGARVTPLSTYGGSQYEIRVSIIKDDVTGNWWLQCGDENIGYFPNEIFTTLANGSMCGGWGGEVYGSILNPFPSMGSGHFPEEGFAKASYIRQMKLLDPSYSPMYPNFGELNENISKPRCFRAKFLGDCGGHWGQTMFFGGPPNCQYWED